MQNMSDKLRKERNDDIKVIVGSVVLIALITLYFFNFSPFGWICRYFGVEQSTWGNIGFSFGQIVAALYVPFLISAKLNTYIAFQRSEELIALQKLMREKESYYLSCADSLKDPVSETLVNDIRRLVERAEAIGESVDMIVPVCRWVIFFGFILNAILMCSEHSCILGPFAIWPILIMPVAYTFGGLRFQYLTISRNDLSAEFNCKDDAYRKHLQARMVSSLKSNQ